MIKLLIALALLLPTEAVAAHVYSGLLDWNTSKVSSLEGDVDEHMFDRYARSVLQTSGIGGDRIVFIDSRGGNVESGHKIEAIMKTEQAHGVRLVCVVMGIAHSMAFNLLTRCDVRLAVAESSCIVHKIRRIMECKTDCTARNLRRIADEVDKGDEPFRQANSRAMGLTLSQYDIYADADTSWTVETLIARKYFLGIATVEK